MKDQTKEHTLNCWSGCKKFSPRRDWKDHGDGMCSEGCCDRLVCPLCGRIVTFECGD